MSFFCRTFAGNISEIMQTIYFRLYQDEEFIPLMQLLKATQIVDMGSEAGRLIAEGQVLRNGKIETRKRAKIQAGEQINIGQYQIIVESTIEQ